MEDNWKSSEPTPPAKPKPSLFPPVSTFGVKPPIQPTGDPILDELRRQTVHLEKIRGWVTAVGIVVVIAGLLALSSFVHSMSVLSIR